MPTAPSRTPADSPVPLRPGAGEHLTARHTRPRRPAGDPTAHRRPPVHPPRDFPGRPSRPRINHRQVIYPC